jgi:hypothetical protein
MDCLEIVPTDQVVITFLPNLASELKNTHSAVATLMCQVGNWEGSVLGSRCRLLWAQPALNLIGYEAVLEAEIAMSYYLTTYL